jgi:hypothetical protein
MATIGEDLMTILGIIPTRDRAGIQRGTMADEAARSSQAAQAPQAPPKFQVPQEMRGPGGDLQLPAEVPTEYASGKAAPKPAAPRVGLSTPLAVPPTQERVVASSPAAAPSPPVQKQASDVYLAALEQRKRQQQMMQVIGHLGMMANAFNRNPDSQASTRASLAGMINGAGGGGGGGNDLANLKTALDMRKEEQQTAAAAAARQRSIDALVKQGLSLEDATVETDNNLHTQRLGLAGQQAREAIRRDEQMRKDLDNPAAIAELARLYHMTPTQMQTAIRNGTVSKFTDPSVLAEVRDKHALASEREQKTAAATADFATRDEARQRPEAVAARYSAKLGRSVNPGEVLMAASTDDTWKKFNEENLATGQAGIAKTRAETDETTAKAGKAIAETTENIRATQQKQDADLSYAFYKKNPDAFARLHGLKDVDEARRIVDDRKAYDKYQETSGPSAYADVARYHDYEREQRALGNKPLSRLEWDKERAKATVQPPEDLVRKAAIDTANKRMDESEQKARAAHRALQERHQQQDLYDPNMITGGFGAENQTNLRLTVARLFNRPDEEASNTKLFFSALKKSMQASGKNQSGPLSDKDLLFLSDLEGGQQLDAAGIRRLQIIHEKSLRFDMAQHNDYYDEKTSQEATRDLKNYYQRVDPPPPGRFILEDLKDSPEAIALLMRNKDNAKAIKQFDKEFGIGVAKYVIENDGKVDE